MVNYNERLDRTFAALVDPTRRAILARLEREDGASISALAQPFADLLAGGDEHLGVLDGCRPHHPVESRAPCGTAPARAHEGSEIAASPARTLL
jgi:hypothetical protein